MTRAYRRPIFDLASLPEDARKEYRRRLHSPNVELGERVGRFESPFEYLRTVNPGFSSQIRFLLNKYLANDPEAAEVWDFWRLTQPFLKWGEMPPPSYFEKDRQQPFFEKHSAELRSFVQTYYPWEHYDPKVYEPERFVANPSVDAMLDEAIDGALGTYGFAVRTASRRKTRWACWSTILPHAILLEIEKTPVGLELCGSIQVPSLHFHENLAAPFFFSGFGVPYGLSHDLRKLLHLFFEQYAKIFPEVLVALEKGIAGAEVWLKERGLYAA